MDELDTVATEVIWRLKGVFRTLIHAGPPGPGEPPPVPSDVMDELDTVATLLQAEVPALLKAATRYS